MPKEVIQRQCKKHGLTNHKKRSDSGYRCSKCNVNQVIKHRKNKKKRLVAHFGGKCTNCGYSKYSGAFQFHHLDPSIKKFSLSVRGLSYSWDKCLIEAEKCVLLCANCHAEVEHMQ